MRKPADLDIFLACAPGLEPVLADEARHKGFKRATVLAGGVQVTGTWADVWRANLWLRTANRVIARLAVFRVDELATLEQTVRRLPWAGVLRADVPVRVEATCTKSRIWHSGAAAERVATGLRAALGVEVREDAALAVMVRLDHDRCEIGVETSGELLHLRGFKARSVQAPLRETLAAAFLFQCGFDGREPVVDPMCGSGTFVLEAAEIAAGLNPGRARRFAFEQLATFDAAAWAAMQAVSARPKSAARMYGFDRDAVAIEASRANVVAARIAERTTLERRRVSELQPPPGPPGLVIVNPPYGRRLGDAADLVALHRALGRVLRERFVGWRIGLVTAERSLAYATALPFLPPGPPVAHGGVRVTLFRTAVLPALLGRDGAGRAH
jgi:putative N6-adenine-specific DNA methylase